MIYECTFTLHRIKRIKKFEASCDNFMLDLLVKNVNMLFGIVSYKKNTKQREERSLPYGLGRGFVIKDYVLKDNVCLSKLLFWAIFTVIVE